MAKLIIEMIGREIYICGACKYRSDTHMGRACPHCHTAFTGVSLVAEGEEVDNAYELSDVEDERN